jgi:hypothetical protein
MRTNHAPAMDHAPQNLAAFRHMALNLLCRETSGIGAKKAQARSLERSFPYDSPDTILDAITLPSILVSVES